MAREDAGAAVEPPIATTIAPWLAVRDVAAAMEFYKDAFGADEAYRLDGGNGGVAVAQLTVFGAPFWLQEDDESDSASAPQASVRMILTVNDPDALFARAISAGAKPVAPMAEAFGWRTGRITDPFGYDWEFSKPLDA